MPSHIARKSAPSTWHWWTNCVGAESRTNLICCVTEKQKPFEAPSDVTYLQFCAVGAKNTEATPKFADMFYASKIRLKTVPDRPLEHSSHSKKRKAVHVEVHGSDFELEPRVKKEKPSIAPVVKLETLSDVDEIHVKKEALSETDTAAG